MSHFHIDRRLFLGGAAGGFFACAMRAGQAAALSQQPKGKAKRCVVLWMGGGPSQMDTFDLKPGTDTGGEFRPISTPAAGLQISETLPEIAKQMDKLSVIRCLTSNEGDHGRGDYFLHTGFPQVSAFPRPAMGAVISHEMPEMGFPRYVTVGTRGYGPAYLGADHAPFSIEDPNAALELMRRIGQRSSRVELMQNLGRSFDDAHASSLLNRRRAMVSRIESLVTTPFVQAVNLSLEPESVRERYGSSSFGTSCLLARRLLEAGVNFVEVTQQGWDTHSDNFNAVRNLCSEIDRPWSALMQDLSASGLLDETIVLWMGEFGRTPQINNGRGRDHFPAVTPVVIGGGGLAGGQAVGRTNENGTEIDGQSYQAADLIATIFDRMGIDPSHEFQTSFGSPTRATDDGEPIKELLA